MCPLVGLHQVCPLVALHQSVPTSGIASERVH
ncbi:hypothetical protein BIW11_04267 [Tropilaelaps mercedesae]|uniref:Uncharacterized protein n=1 Tax=Tropilaelaps mercedesae TaxID=418985 RepID=A0A1V9X934_9ACAR|nr:hypothetical protein BIW11_04267 [Tropilaelaps mercedesae]